MFDSLLASSSDRCILVCQNVHCHRNGSRAVLAALAAANLPEDVAVVASDCHSQCHLGPSVRIQPDETWYARVQPSDVPHIVEEHLRHDRPVTALLNPRIHMAYHSYGNPG